MKVVYQITVEIDDEEIGRSMLHEDLLQQTFDNYWHWAPPGSLRVLHSKKISERDK